MQPANYWSASQPEGAELLRELVTGLGVGTGGYYGLYSGLIEFFILTPQMREYLEETILGGNGVAAVTVYLHNPRIGTNSGFAAYQGELVSPYVLNSEASYTRFSDRTYANNQYLFRRGTVQADNLLLLESGDAILLENGNTIALEAQ